MLMKLNKTSQMLNIPSSSLLQSLLKLQKEIPNPEVRSIVKICGQCQQIFWSTNFQMKNDIYTIICTTSSPYLPVNELK